MIHFFKPFAAAALAVGMLMQVALPASADQFGGMGPNARFARQQHRINTGVRNGSLTRREYAHDQRHLNSIERQTSRERAMNGGRLTAGERAHTEGRLNSNSSRIDYTKHNLRQQP